MQPVGGHCCWPSSLWRLQQLWVGWLHLIGLCVCMTFVLKHHKCPVTVDRLCYRKIQPIRLPDHADTALHRKFVAPVFRGYIHCRRDSSDVRTNGPGGTWSQPASSGNDYFPRSGGKEAGATLGAAHAHDERPSFRAKGPTCQSTAEPSRHFGCSSG